MLLDTIKLNREIRPTSSGVNIFYPYKGTKLGDYCFETGLVDDESIRLFTSERRKTVLNYDETWKNKLSLYQKNWEVYVYTIWSIRGIKPYVRRIPILGRVIRKVYRVVYPVVHRMLPLGGS